jgi:hypothetical protein
MESYQKTRREGRVQFREPPASIEFGIGFDPAQRKALFQPHFFDPLEFFGGTVLGLGADLAVDLESHLFIEKDRAWVHPALERPVGIGPAEVLLLIIKNTVPGIVFFKNDQLIMVRPQRGGKILELAGFLGGEHNEQLSDP